MNPTCKAGLLAALVAGLSVVCAALAQNEEILARVKGLGYSADGKKLMVSGHDGLAIYERGRWSSAPGPRHDFTGFASTRRNLYASGRPALGSGLPNPVGLILSRDGGRTWDKLGLEGEITFSLLAAGWNTDALYVWNPQPNSRMGTYGVYYTRDGGQTWQAAAELDGDLQALAAHPNRAGTVAVGTTEGVFLSRNFGGSFETLARDVQGLALYFDLDGEHLWLSSFAGEAYLSRIDLQTRTIEPAPTPHWGKDAVSYIAQNPALRTEYAVATLGGSMYLSRDGGRTWATIANRGWVR